MSRYGTHTYSELSETTAFPKTGAAYIRVSTDDQTELSPAAQLRVIRDAADADGYQIPDDFVFIEKRGISGRHAENRPEFQRMIAVAKAQRPAPFTRLYLWKFSRFARNQDESTFYKGILRKKCGIEIKSVSEPVMEGMFGRLIETIIEWFDEYYSVNLSEEVLRGMTEKALRNGYQTSPCLGYMAAGDGRPFLMVPDEIRTVEQIFSSFAAGNDMTEIAESLNAQGLRTKRGNPFDRRAIRRILENPFYTGTVLWNGFRFAGSHETSSVITGLESAVKERLDTEYMTANRRESSACAHPLSGLLFCSSCGAALVFHRSGRSRYFQCWRYSKGLHKTSCSISARKAEAAVCESLRQILGEEKPMPFSELSAPVLRSVYKKIVPDRTSGTIKFYYYG